MEFKEKFNLWQNNLPKGTALFEELEGIKGSDEEIYERFYSDLTFGTGGLRGTLGVGSNRMNIYTVGVAVRGIAEYLKRKSSSPTAVIAHDSRHMGKEFSELAASVLSECGVKVYLFDRLMPTPVLSYAVRKLGCTGGLMITASHNPKEYNGMKAYNADGCQLSDEDSSEIIDFIKTLNIFDIKKADFKTALNEGKVVMVGDDLVTSYLETVKALSMRDNLKDTDINIVYTPLYGTGMECVERVLREQGLPEQRITIVEEQREPNGDFPTCPYPNPESKEAMKLGFSKLHEGDILIATDPDADRVGIGLIKNGEEILLGGNDVGILLLDYIITALNEKNKLPSNGVLISTIVSTKMVEAIAKKHNLSYMATLTGFKYIGAAMDKALSGNKQLIFSFEESCGYLPGNYIRDKDGVSAAMLIAEMAAHLKSKNIDVIDRLNELRVMYGNHYELVSSIAFKGSQGMKEMADIMSKLRSNPPTQIGDAKIAFVRDYLNGTDTANGVAKKADIMKSNVVAFHLETEETIIVRPSGTEPKLKFYLLLKGDKERGKAIIKATEDLLSK